MSLSMERVSEILLETDFAGQKLADRTYQWVIVIFSVLAFVAGYAQESLRVAFQIWLVGAVLASALCLFGWPWLRRHPVTWLPSVDAPIPREDEAGAEDAGDADAAAAAAGPLRVADRVSRVGGGGGKRGGKGGNR